MPEPAPPHSAQQACRPVFPEATGIGLAVTLVAGLISVGVLGHVVVQRQADRARASKHQALTNVFAAALAPVAEQDDTVVAAALGHLCGSASRLYAAEWLGTDGGARCRWPASFAPGQPGGGAAPGTSAGVTPARTPAPDGLATFTAPVQTAGGTPAGTLRLTFTRASTSGQSPWLLCGCAAAIAVTLLVYVGLYRQLRRHLRPVDAIQRNLRSYATGLERDLAALSLSDSLGQVAQGWNQLIEQVSELRGRDARAGSTELAGDLLRRFESRTLRSTLDRLPIGLLRFGAEQQVTYANVAAARLLGHSLETLVGTPLTDVVDEEIRTPLLGAYLRSGTTMSIDRKRGDDEQQSTLRFALIPAAKSAADDEALVTIEDVSHLQEADRTRDNFLYHVTHELRTPLTNIQAYAETLTGPGFDDEQTRRECYNVIISETRRLSRLVENILNISQLEVGTARMELGEVDLVRLLRQIVQDHLGAADEKKIDLTLKLAPKVPKARGDKQRLSVLITNLLGNAIKYTPEGGRVDVTLEVRERCVEIAVADTGIGIAPEDQSHVFDKFYRATSDDVQTIAGTGLGLAIAREVARLHGGDIHLESEVGQGSKFVVELPVDASEG